MNHKIDTRDYVICTDSECAALTKGQYYQVCSTGNDVILIQNDKGYREWYRPNRFKKQADLQSENAQLKEQLSSLQVEMLNRDNAAEGITKQLIKENERLKERVTELEQHILNHIELDT